jgi:hypothetical protein
MASDVDVGVLVILPCIRCRVLVGGHLNSNKGRAGVRLVTLRVNSSHQRPETQHLKNETEALEVKPTYKLDMLVLPRRIHRARPANTWQTSCKTCVTVLAKASSWYRPSTHLHNLSIPGHRNWNTLTTVVCWDQWHHNEPHPLALQRTNSIPAIFHRITGFACLL